MRRDDPQGAELRIPLEDEGATEALGRRIGALVHGGDLIGLEGELGAGKTTLVRGLHSALRVDGRVRSPSFVTMIEYDGDPPLHHFDLFRYEGAGAGFLEEFEEWIFGDGVTVIEWADRLGSDLPRPHLLIGLEILEPSRIARILGKGERWRPVIAALEGEARAR